MTGSLDGRIALITGAGRGLGREYARLFAAEGASVVVNDTGRSSDGRAADSTTSGTDVAPSAAVVAEIESAGGRAVTNDDDVADFEGAEQAVATAIETFGGLDIVINNAGILRDRLIVNMTEDEWDEVVRVHLKGHFAPTHFAAVYWRDEHKAGRGHPRRLVHTASTSGLMSNPGQSNYGAAKSGVATFSQIAAKELARYDVASNCIAPAARTRLTMSSPGLDDIMAPREGAFDEWDPANVAPVVAYLASERCRFNGETFFVQGGVVQRMRPWDLGDSVRNDTAWTVDSLVHAFESW
ncbi:SDR family oxidoreductase [soil metagenome]